MQGTKSLSLAISIIIALLAAFGIVAASLRLHGPWSIAVSTLLSVVLSVGLIGLVYEIWLRDGVARELLTLVRLKESVHQSGMTEIVLSTHTDWAAIFLGSREFTLMPRDVATFASREWPHVLEAGRERKIEVRLLLPNQAGPSLQVLEAHLGEPPGSLASTVDKARQSMVTAWESAAKAQPPLKSGSSLQVFDYDDFPGCAIFLTDATVAIELTATLSRRPGDQGCMILFDAKRNSPYVSWATGQIERACGEDKIVDLKEVP